MLAGRGSLVHRVGVAAAAVALVPLARRVQAAWAVLVGLVQRTPSQERQSLMQAVAGLARSPVVQQAQAVRVAAVLAAIRLQAQQAQRTRVAVAVVRWATRQAATAVQAT